MWNCWSGVEGLMPQLYTLYYGRSKQRMHSIMTDLLKKCENYRDSRQSSMKGGHAKAPGHYEIKAAEPGSKPWKKDTSSQWTNYDAWGPVRVPRK